ncbi:MAG: 2-amino-4-hydroxy-6-hydroxymethyldihydropteridine diphosphokinase [Spirochaetaceae bacterium]|jgi:2-amino-4-hydroxy-6-hydroxymethyldihydropteridine diphosphokinase|nr:2-amino-4-hydroxy-6-hydroxymethyldihydropteridine diphosphokinase [Spirochaetaceae bacterium]
MPDIFDLYLGLGSNIEPRIEYIDHCILSLKKYLDPMAISSIYETDAQDFTEQPAFLNAVVHGKTNLTPGQWLEIKRTFETEAKRERDPRLPKGPRTLDLDILLMGDRIVNEPTLQIPHPRIRNRRFVMEPLLEIHGDLQLPGDSLPLQDYLLAVSSQGLRIFRTSTK